MQVYAPTRGTIEVTACYMSCYLMSSGRWDLWPQDMIAPLGSVGYLSPEGFGPGNSTLWPQSDSAESRHIPQNQDITRFKPWLYGQAPAIHGTLQVGVRLYLKNGAPFLGPGNREVAWDSDGYLPVVARSIVPGTRSISTAGRGDWRAEQPDRIAIDRIHHQRSPPNDNRPPQDRVAGSLKPLLL